MYQPTEREIYLSDNVTLKVSINKLDLLKSANGQVTLVTNAVPFNTDPRYPRESHGLLKVAFEVYKDWEDEIIKKFGNQDLQCVWHLDTQKFSGLVKELIFCCSLDTKYYVQVDFIDENVPELSRTMYYYSLGSIVEMNSYELDDIIETYKKFKMEGMTEDG